MIGRLCAATVSGDARLLAGLLASASDS